MKQKYTLELLQKERSSGRDVTGSSALLDLTLRTAKPVYTAPHSLRGLLIVSDMYLDNRAEKDLRGDLLGCECDPKIKASTCVREHV